MPFRLVNLGPSISPILPVRKGILASRPTHPTINIGGSRLSDNGGGREGFGWHRAVEMPGDCDRAIAGVADVLPSSQEEVRGGAELVDLVLPGKEQDGAAFTSVIDVPLSGR